MNQKQPTYYKLYKWVLIDKSTGVVYFQTWRTKAGSEFFNYMWAKELKDYYDIKLAKIVYISADEFFRPSALTDIQYHG